MTMDIVLDDGAFLPVHAHDADAGYDLKSPDHYILPARGSISIDTGVHVAIPDGMYGKLESKSGLNVRHGIVCLGGIIDSSYNGSIVVKLYNMTDEDYSFDRGDKIVQIIFQKMERPIFNVVDHLKETERGDKGFGSSGK